MHELSIALGIVKIAEDEASKAKANKVTKIELEIGVLSGVEIDSLNFIWESAVKDSILEFSEKQISIIEWKSGKIDSWINGKNSKTLWRSSSKKSVNLSCNF